MTVSDAEEQVVNKKKSHRKDKRMFSYAKTLVDEFNIFSAWDTDDVDQYVLTVPLQDL